MSRLYRSNLIMLVLTTLGVVILVVIAVAHGGAGDNPAAALPILGAPFIVIFALGVVFARRLERSAGSGEKADGVAKQHASLMPTSLRRDLVIVGPGWQLAWPPSFTPPAATDRSCLNGLDDMDH